MTCFSTFTSSLVVGAQHKHWTLILPCPACHNHSHACLQLSEGALPLHCRNNENLGRLSCKIVSPLVFAHVRAAYPGMPVSEQNCHPFQFSRYLWMHNGVIGGFMKIRRALLSTLADAAYDTVSSFHSDSAISFSIFLNHLPDLNSQQTPQVLLQAMEVWAGAHMPFCHHCTCQHYCLHVVSVCTVAQSQA